MVWYHNYTVVGSGRVTLKTQKCQWRIHGLGPLIFELCSMLNCYKLTHLEKPIRPIFFYILVLYLFVITYLIVTNIFFNFISFFLIFCCYFL